jgi:sec-independent protein translocase protein TatA
MFGLGMMELVVIGAIIFLLFGAKRLPQLGRSMGESITNFKKGLKESQDEEKKTEDGDDSNNNPQV